MDILFIRLVGWGFELGAEEEANLGSYATFIVVGQLGKSVFHVFRDFNEKGFGDAVGKDVCSCLWHTRNSLI